MEIVRIITIALITALPGYLLGLITIKLRNQNTDFHNKVLKVPKMILCISCVITIPPIIVAACCIFVNEGQDALSSIFMIPITISNTWLVLYSLNWKIEIKEDSFIYTNPFGKKREYNYADITKVKRIKIGGYKIYIKSKKITVDYWIIGIENLWNIIKLLN